MRFQELSKPKALEAWNQWTEMKPRLPEISGNDLEMRNELQRLFKKAIQENSENQDSEYALDVRFGLYLFNYLNSLSGFSLRIAESDGFWRFLTLKVIPDLVGQRWGTDKQDHYWLKPGRIWPKQLFWFIYYSWQGDDEKTAKVLLDGSFSTDTILNLVERTGSNGVCVPVYREIVTTYGHLPKAEIQEINKRFRQRDKHMTLFRAVLKLHTARCLLIDPQLVPGGVKAYVQSLFEEAGAGEARGH